MKKLDPRSVIIGFLVAVIGFMSIGATDSTFDSITVGEIKMKNETLPIRDMQGETVVGIAGSGLVRGLIVMDRKGEMNAIIGTSENGGRISIYNAIEQPSITLFCSDDYSGVLSINNKWGVNIAHVTATPEGDGYIILSDKHGEGQWGVSGNGK